MVSAISGRDVILHEKTQNGTDAFNNPVMVESQVTVSNVLIEPASNEAIVSEIQVSGKHIAYTLHIPKGDPHNWKDALVEFYGSTWRTFGDCLIYDENLTPLDWNKKVKVERYE